MPDSPPDSDDDLLLRAGRGDNTAVAGCIDRFGPLVVLLAKRLLINQSEVEDATAEVFGELWKNASKFDPSIASSRAFVAMMARRRIIDRGRKEQVRIRAVVGLEAVNASATIDHTIDDDVQAVVGLVERLPDEWREALRLSLGQGWSHQRIADHLAVPLGTVKSNIRRGLLQLRLMLQPAANDTTGALR